MVASQTPPPRGSAHATLVVMFGIGVSRVFGLVREQVVAFYFGRSAAYSAFVAAYKVPNLVRVLLGEGNLSASFIPVLAEKMRAGEAEGTDRLARGVLGLLLAVVAVVTLAGMAAAPALAWIVAPGFDPALRELGHRSGPDFFMQLGELTRDDDPPVRPGQRKEIRQEVGQPGWGLIEDDAPFLLSGTRQQAGSFPALSGNETQKEVAVCAEPGGRECGRYGGSAGKRNDRDTRRSCQGDELDPGIAHGGSSRVRHQCNVPARAQDIEQGALPVIGRVGVEAEQGRCCAQMAQESPSAPGVLCCDHRDASKHLGGAMGQVTQVAQRSGDDIQGARGHSESREGREGRPSRLSRP